MQQLVVSDDGLYWHDGTTISALSRGQAAPSALYAIARSAPAGTAPAASTSEPFITGLVADTDHVYWSEGSFDITTDLGFAAGGPAPGRLLSMPKAGGAVQVLLAASAKNYHAVAAEDTRVILKLRGVGAEYYAFSKLDQSVSPLSVPAPYDSSVVGDQIYWTDPSEESPRLLRAQFDAHEPESITPIEGSDFAVGPGYVLWRHEQLVTEPELVLQQNFVIWRSGSGCVQSLPGTGESISYGLALDARYVYWHSFNALGAVSPSDGTTPASPPPEISLVRLDLQSGELQRLRASGFRSSLGDQILGLDAEQLFVATQAGLVAIRTP